MGIDDPIFDLDDEALIRNALPTVDIDLLMKQGFLRIEGTEEMLLYGDGGFGTPDGKAALYSGELASLGHDPLPSYRPTIEGPSGPLATTYPLMLLSPKNHTRFLNSTYSGHHRDRETGPYVEIDPADAAARGISEGDPVRVWNERGTLSLPARISTRLRPGVVAIPWAWWGKEANVNLLTSDTPADWGGGVAFFDTLVEAALA
jgi:anaerobic selenocysteine-containing dehydrogenase